MASIPSPDLDSTPTVGGFWRVGRRFKDSSEESGFHHWHARLHALQRRAALYFALIAWSAASGFDLDPGQFGAVHVQIFVMRAIGAAALVCAIGASRSDRFLRFQYGEAVIAVPSTVCQILLAAMVTTEDAPFEFVADIPGPILAMFATVGLYRIRAKTYLAILAIIIPVITVYIYSATARSLEWEDHVKGTGAVLILRSYNFYRPVAYVLIGAVISYVIAVQLERSSRDAFARERRLATANGDLWTSRLDVEAKSAALIAATEELRASAQRENANKSKFLADATHDLSQPIHAVSLLLAAADHSFNTQDTPRVGELLAEAGRAVRVARASFRSILDFSRFESGMIEPKIEIVNLQTLLVDLLPPLRSEAAASGVTIRVRRSEGGRMLVSSDRELLGRLVGNLISNAIRYSDAAKKSRRTLILGVIRFSGRTRIDVFDNGVGIPGVLQEEIFSPYRQLRAVGETGTGGIGLGLSIVQAIIGVLPDHSLRVSSAEGRYSRFSVYLPAAQRGESETRSSFPGAREEQDLSSLYVWCVENDPVARAATVITLKGWGILCEQAASFEDVERELVGAERRPDLIVTDYRLPNGHDANEVAAVFKSRWGSGIPMLVISGEGDPPIDARFAPTFITLRKPASRDEIVVAIGALCLTPEGGPGG